MNDPMQNQQLPPDWKADWLYALIFKEIDQWCSCGEPDCYSLIEEYADDDGSECTGAMLRAWKREQQAMNEITLQDLLTLKHHRRDEFRLSYECLVKFHIRPDRQRVVWGWYSPFRIGGSGGRYRVVGQMNNAVLKSEGGGWIS
jgi:hypothetical protein